MKFRLRWNGQFDEAMGNVKPQQEDDGLPTRGIFPAMTKDGKRQNVLVRGVEQMSGTMYVEVSPIAIEENAEVIAATASA